MFLAAANSAGKALGSLKRITEGGLHTSVPRAAPPRSLSVPPPPGRRKQPPAPVHPQAPAPPDPVAPAPSGDADAEHPTDAGQSAESPVGAWGQALPADVAPGVFGAHVSESALATRMPEPEATEAEEVELEAPEPEAVEPEAADSESVQAAASGRPAPPTPSASATSSATQAMSDDERPDWRDSMVTTGAGFRLPPPPAPIHLPPSVDQAEALRDYQVVDERSDSMAAASQAETSA